MKFTKYFFAFLLFPLSVLSQELQEKFHDWSVFKTTRSNEIVCYIASTPISRDKTYNKRGESFFLVTNIKNDADEVSVSSGFLYKKTSNVEISFKSRKFYLFPYRSLAWANDRNDDIDVIKEMQKQDEMIVSGVSQDGKIYEDKYSLIGFTQSYDKMQKLCEDYK
jgi:hypothetical protein